MKDAPVRSGSRQRATENQKRARAAKVCTGQWDFSPAEITWAMKRTRELLLAAGNDGGDKRDIC